MAIDNVPHWHLPGNHVECPACHEGSIVIGLDHEAGQWYWRCPLCKENGRAMVDLTEGHNQIPTQN